MTRLLVALPLSVRESLARASKISGLSQQSLIRSGVAALLAKNDAPPEQPAPAKRTRKTNPKTKLGGV